MDLGDGVADLFLQGFDPLPTQRLPLCTILRYPLLATDPKHFLKTPSHQCIVVLKGSRRQKKKRIFWSKFFKNCLRTPFLACFFKTLPPAQKIWPKYTEQCFGRARKINLVELRKKKPSKLSRTFLKICPPSRKS